MKDAGAKKVFPISGATGKGMEKLLDAVLEYLPAKTMGERAPNEDYRSGDEGDAPEKPWSPLG